MMPSSLRTEASRYTCLTWGDAVVETWSRGRGTSAHHELRTTRRRPQSCATNADRSASPASTSSRGQITASQAAF